MTNEGVVGKHGVSRRDAIKMFALITVSTSPEVNNVLKIIGWGSETETSSRQAGNLMLSKSVGPTDAKYRLLIETPTEISTNNKDFGISSIAITRLTDSQDIQEGENGRPSITLERVGTVTTDMLVPAEAKHGAIVYESTGLIITQDMLPTKADGTPQNLKDYSPNGKLLYDATIGEYTFGKMRIVVVPNDKGHNSIRASIIADNGRVAVSGIVFNKVEPIDNQGIQVTEDPEKGALIFSGVDTRALERKQKEVREFVPAETFVYVSNLSEVDLEVDPIADEKAIYWDFVGTLVSSLKLTDSNEAILKQVLNDESIPQDKRNSWSDLSNNSDKKLRLELMQAFLQKSGGKVDITTIGYVLLENADLNQPPIFESIQVDKIPDGYINFVAGNSEDGSKLRGAGKIYLSENGQVVISIAHHRGVLNAILKTESQSWYKNFGWTPEMIESEAFLRLVEYHADRNVGVPLAGILTSDPNLYLYGSNIINDSKSGERLNSQNVKGGFLKIKSK